MDKYIHPEQAIFADYMIIPTGGHNVTTVGSNTCDRFWDPVLAKVTPCYLPWIEAIPLILAGVTLLIYALRLLIPYRPEWMTSFVDEYDEKRKKNDYDVIPNSKRHIQPLPVILFLCSLVGLGLSTTLIWFPTFQFENIYPALTWVLIIGFLVIIRPSTTPKAVLILTISLSISRLIIIKDKPDVSRNEFILSILELLMGVTSIVIILNMPLRDPELPLEDIAPTYTVPTFEHRSPEDSLTLWQFMTQSWVMPMLKLAKTRQIHDEDVWLLGYQFQHRRLHEKFRRLKGSVTVRLLNANGLDLLILTLIAIIDLGATYGSPLILQQILKSFEDNSPASAKITYALIAWAINVIQSQNNATNVWFGRRCYERSRGELIMMLYEKTLSRKVFGSAPKKLKSEEQSKTTPEAESTEANGPSKPDTNSVTQKVRSCWQGSRSLIPFAGKKVPEKKDVKEPASMGKILNLMRNDVYEVSQRFWDFTELIETPVGIIVAMALVWKLMGWTSLLGVATVFIAQVINVWLSKIRVSWEKKRRKATDAKLKQVSQFVEAIRHLRWYGWQDQWLTRIMDARQHELNLRLVAAALNILISFINIFASGMFPVASFYAYCKIAGLPMRVDIAFPALSLFSLLDQNLRNLPNLITVVINAHVAMTRIEEFMAEPEKAKDDDSTDNKPKPSANGHTLSGDGAQGIISNGNGNGHAIVSTDIGDTFELKDASFSWPGGPSVLHSLTLSFSPGFTLVFGEVGSGKTALLQALLGELDRENGELYRPSGIVGYCKQTPWLQSMNIRENIIFGAPYEEKRYKEVLEACALTPDLANFKHGDLSNIGENGIGLSGGQKARVALARAVYSRANTLLLDDPISALDHQTAEFIMQKCFAGNLTKGRTVILVTHRTELCRKLADQAIEMSHGRARVIDLEQATDDTLHPVESNTEEATDEDNDKLVAAAVPDKFMEDEHRAHGGVPTRVYWEYIKAGKAKFWLALILTIGCYQCLIFLEAWFLRAWGEGYDTESNIRTAWKDPLSDLPSPTKEINPWLIGFAAINISKAFISLIRRSVVVTITYSSGKAMFIAAMTAVGHATFRYYDVTPVGRLMNRMTSDVSSLDGPLAEIFQVVVLGTISFVFSLIVIASVAPAFLVFSIILALGFLIAFSYFLPASQSLRRLEMVSLSPLMSNFGTLLEGLMTVRAFRAQERFQDRLISVTDSFQKMDHFYWSVQTWVSYRFDMISDLSTFAITTIAVVSGLSAGLTAFALMAARRFIVAVHWLCKTYGRMQMEFVSVERVLEIMDLEQEPPGTVDPPAWWPTLTGDIIFENATLRYAPQLDPALIDLSFKIKAGSNCAIVGRTGSGKSTMAMALLATLIPDEGRILIDNVDIATVNKQALRHRVTFVAQDPVLFPGSMRQNLDPMEEFLDEDCKSVLQKIAGRHGWTLETEVEAGGKNLSQGQRQLIGLARTVLRRSPIVILDEATASIDMETAEQIQEVLHEEMKESTVITIAHRLEAVKYADYCIVLSKGRLLKAGSAAEILKDGITNVSEDAS